MNSKELYLRIQDLSIYDGDKEKAVIKLLKELGHKVDDPILPQSGEIWKTQGSDYFIIDPSGKLGAFKPNNLIAVSLSGHGFCPNVIRSVTTDNGKDWEFVASNLKEYYGR